MHLRLTLAGALVAVLAGPATAVAQTPTLQLNKKCYVSATETQRELVGLAGQGFMPDTPIDVLVDEVLQPMPQPPMTDALGNITGSVMAPFIASGQRDFTVRLAEKPSPTRTASAVAKVTALSVTQSPKKAATTSSRVRFRVRGFTDRLRPIYAHYVFNGKLRKTVQMGKPYGDCGLLSVRRHQFPFKHPKLGPWSIQFDQEQVYNPAAPLYTRLPVTVSRTPKPRG